LTLTLTPMTLIYKLQLKLKTHTTTKNELLGEGFQKLNECAMQTIQLIEPYVQFSNISQHIK